MSEGRYSSDAVSGTSGQMDSNGNGIAGSAANALVEDNLRQILDRRHSQLIHHPSVGISTISCFVTTD